MALLAGSFLASCSTSTDPLTRLGVSPQQLALSGAVAPASQVTVPAPHPASDPIVQTSAAGGYMFLGENDRPLPKRVAAVPTLRDGGVQLTAADPVQPAPGTGARLAPAPQQQAAAAQPVAAKVQADVNLLAQSRIDAATPPQPPAAESQAATPTKRGFFASLFGTADAAQPAPAASAFAPPRQAPAQPAPQQASLPPQPTQTAPATPAPAQVGAAAPQKATAFIENIPAAQPQPLIVQGPKASMAAGLFGSSAMASGPRPLIKPNAVAAPVTLASVGPQDSGSAAQKRELFSMNALPGVRASELFEIKRKSGTDDDSDVDIYEDEGPVELASAGGMARLAPNGLLKQTDHVDVACLKPTLVRVLKAIEGHYGKQAVITSGYRSPPRNMRARGAPNSLHMYCAAADVQVEGVSKWELAEFVRTMPGRGGVGTYCHTNSVHVDVGPERDWNWRCRRGKKRA